MDINLPYHIAEAYAETEEHSYIVGGWTAGLANGKLNSAWALEQHAVPENPASTMSAYEMQLRGNAFRVVIPLSGGLDSATLLHMARDAEMPIIPVYVDCGQEYRDSELASVRELLGESPWIVKIDLEAVRYKHIVAGRNAAIIQGVAAAADAMGHWGQVWFGNLAGESPIVGGDKSARFLATMQGILHASGLDFHLLSPLIGLDKPDIIRWWHDNDHAADLIKTKSCFDPSVRRCGKCQSCFRMAVALIVSGLYDVRGKHGPEFMRQWFGDSWDFSESVAKYSLLMTSGEANPYNARRTRDTLYAIALLEGIKERR